MSEEAYLKEQERCVNQIASWKRGDLIVVALFVLLIILVSCIIALILTEVI